MTPKDDDQQGLVTDRLCGERSGNIQREVQLNREGIERLWESLDEKMDEIYQEVKRRNYENAKREGGDEREKEILTRQAGLQLVTLKKIGLVVAALLAAMKLFEYLNALIIG